MVCSTMRQLSLKLYSLETSVLLEREDLECLKIVFHLSN